MRMQLAFMTCLAALAVLIVGSESSASTYIAADCDFEPGRCLVVKIPGYCYTLPDGTELCDPGGEIVTPGSKPLEPF